MAQPLETLPRTPGRPDQISLTAIIHLQYTPAGQCGFWPIPPAIPAVRLRLRERDGLRQGAPAPGHPRPDSPRWRPEPSAPAGGGRGPEARQPCVRDAAPQAEHGARVAPLQNISFLSGKYQVCALAGSY